MTYFVAHIGMYTAGIHNLFMLIIMTSFSTRIIHWNINIYFALLYIVFAPRAHVKVHPQSPWVSVTIICVFVSTLEYAQRRRSHYQWTLVL